MLPSQPLISLWPCWGIVLTLINPCMSPAAAVAMGNVGGTGDGIAVAPAGKILPPTPASRFKRLKIFIRSTKKDRSKKEEKKRRSQDGGGEWQSNPSDLPVPAGCCGLHEMNEANSLDFREFSENVNHLFPESRLQGQHGSISTTNVAPQSASNSLSKKGVGASSSITDPRLWASSDIFICEEFTFYDRKGRDSQNKDFLPPPRSYSQVLYGGRQDELRDHLDATDNLSDQLPDNFTQDDRFGGLSPELSLALSNDSLDMECFKVGSDVMVDDQADMAGVLRWDPM